MKNEGKKMEIKIIKNGSDAKLDAIIAEFGCFGVNEIGGVMINEKGQTIPTGKINKKGGVTSKIDCIFLFGKYKGKLVSEVYEENSEYLEWLLENCDLQGGLLKAVEYHLGVD